MKRLYGSKLRLVPCYEEYLMTLGEIEGILEMKNNHKRFLDCYKMSITVDFDGIDAPVEGIYVMLREYIMIKAFLETKGKMYNLILSVDRGVVGLARSIYLSLIQPYKKKMCWN